MFSRQVVLSVFIALFALPSFAKMDLASDAMLISNAYVRATVAKQTNTAAYFQLKNESKISHQIISITSPVADKVQMHESIDENGMAKMQRLAAIDVAAEQTVALQPGGMHVMFMGLHSELKPGESIPLTFAFEDGSSVMLTVLVRQV